MKPEHGGCFGRQPGTGHRCLCSGFVEATEAEPAKPPSVPPLRVVELPEQLQPIRETTAAELDEHAKRRTFDPGRLVGAERNAPAVLQPSVPLFIGGNARETTELNAAANGIIAETNATDLATGVHEMRQKIRTQATALNEARAELEAKEAQLLEQASFQNAIALALGVPYTTERGVVLRKAAEAIEEGKRLHNAPGPVSVELKFEIQGLSGPVNATQEELVKLFSKALASIAVQP